MAKQKLEALALGYAVAILSGLGMLLLGIFGRFGIYYGAAQQMMQAHMFFSLSPLGVITGIIEAMILGFLGGFLTGWFYNKFV